MEFRDRGEDEFESSINIIPLVDIMLVLLIIFMITAPVLKHAFEVDVPDTESTSPAEFRRDIPVITVKRGGVLKVDGVRVRNLKELRAYIRRLGKKEALIEADERLSYGFVVKVMDALRSEGIKKIGLITEEPRSGK